MTGADIASAPKIRPIRSDSLITDVLDDLNKLVAAVSQPDGAEIYWDFEYSGEPSDTWPYGKAACFVSEGNESPIVNLGVLVRTGSFGYGPHVYKGLGAVKPMGADERPYAHRICQAVTDAICSAEY